MSFTQREYGSVYWCLLKFGTYNSCLNISANGEIIMPASIYMFCTCTYVFICFHCFAQPYFAKDIGRPFPWVSPDGVWCLSGVERVKVFLRECSARHNTGEEVE